MEKRLRYFGGETFSKDVTCKIQSKIKDNIKMDLTVRERDCGVGR